MVVKKLEDRSEINRFGVVSMTEEGRVTEIDENLWRLIFQQFRQVFIL